MSKRKNAGIILATYLLAGSSSDDDDDDRESIPQQRKRSVWRKDWLGLRDTDGFCAKLLKELREGEPELYRNFIRMSAAQFDHLLALVAPLIEKSNTNMRMRLSISASERLVLTLRYLATGDNFRSLQFLFRIPQTTISRIIPEVVDAIYKVLVDDFLKVSVYVAFDFALFSSNHSAFLLEGAENRSRMGGSSTEIQRIVAFPERLRAVK